MKTLLTAEISRPHIEELEQLLELQYAGWVETKKILSEDQMVELVKDKEILITSYDPITKRVIDAAPDLKLIVCTRANPVNVDTGYARQKGIKVSYSPGRNTTCTAEFTVALMLSIMRKIPIAYSALHSGQHVSEKKRSNTVREGLRADVTWALDSNSPYVLYKGRQLSGRNLGIIGYGSIGRAVAKLCRGFGMHILIYDPFVDPDTLEEDTRSVSLDELLAQSDVVTVHCKDTPETRGIVNAEAFGKMKKTAYFINTSRGALVEEQALISALLNHEIAGAAVDVFESEPIAKDHPFLTQCDNIVVTPHLAGATYDAIINHTIALVKDIKHFIDGEPLEFEYTH
ncbi:2-hydroxyacid dehydrogenase [Clostridium sp. KNHs216]|uniref:2-hydroxyacid dehydrogenase n=1 Tax=Clostridium sp. KNHs216 TaxID=1550235 RepID=UPI00114DAFDC|nr:2-hydroxyacid dehydrogenase [Clostridium sp. KNHs216]TQI68239.1 D-3-phosphoglycerate dehydrogenase [Clostridium sp. KNHs216]